MEEQNTFEQQTQPNNLNTLTTLTFVYSGFVGFFALMGMLLAKPFFNFLEDNYDTLTSQLNEQQLAQLQQVQSMGSGTFIIACGVYLLVLGLSFFGAMQMKQGKHKGFVMYVIANGFFFLSNLVALNFFLAAIDGIFIYLYYRNSKALKR